MKITDTRSTLSQTELNMIEKWVRLADSIGFPRSYAQIYGLCFISKDPICAQDCVDLLQISRSSAGQGLRILKDFGAIRSVFLLGSRVERFSIEPDLGVFIKSFVEGKIAPAFDSFFQDMEASREQIASEKHNAFLTSRVRKLERWRSKLRRARKWLTL